jgi:hypothetical protein
LSHVHAGTRGGPATEWLSQRGGEVYCSSSRIGSSLFGTACRIKPACFSR